MGSRLLMHPVLQSKKGRWLLIVLIVVVTISSVFLKMRIYASLAQIGIQPQSLSSYELNPVVLFLLSLPFTVFIGLLGAVVGASLINRQVMGPLKRIEQWLLDWEKGQEVGPLHSRNGEIYQNLIDLLNKFYETFGKTRP